MSQEEDQVEEEIERDWKCMDARTPISSPMKTCLHSKKRRDEFTSDFTLLIKHQNQYVASLKKSSQGEALLYIQIINVKFSKVY